MWRFRNCIIDSCVYQGKHESWLGIHCTVGDIWRSGEIVSFFYLISGKCQIGQVAPFGSKSVFSLYIFSLAKNKIRQLFPGVNFLRKK